MSAASDILKLIKEKEIEFVDFDNLEINLTSFVVFLISTPLLR